MIITGAYLRGGGGAKVGTGTEGTGGAGTGGRGGCSKDVLSLFSPLSIEIKSAPPGTPGCDISVTPRAYSCRDSPSTFASSSSSPSPKSSSSSGQSANPVYLAVMLSVVSKGERRVEVIRACVGRTEAARRDRQACLDKNARLIAKQEQRADLQRITVRSSK